MLITYKGCKLITRSYIIVTREQKCNFARNKDNSSTFYQDTDRDNSSGFDHKF